MTMFYGAPGLMTLEALTDAPCPRVRITITGLGTTPVVLKVTRTVANEAATVPGARARDSVDSDVLIDYAAPLNIQVTYTLYVDGVIADVKTITLESATAWIQDPLQPDRALPVSVTVEDPEMLYMRGGALGAVEYPNRVAQMSIMGDRFPVAFGGQRQAAAGVDSSLSSKSPATAEAFRLMVSEAPILLLRTVSEMVPLPPLAYLLANVAEQPMNVHIGGNLTVWSVTGDLVRAVQQSAISGFITYAEAQELLSPYTYDEVQTVCAGTTYLDWQKNPLIFSTL